MHLLSSPPLSSCELEWWDDPARRAQELLRDLLRVRRLLRHQLRQARDLRGAVQCRFAFPRRFSVVVAVVG